MNMQMLRGFQRSALETKSSVMDQWLSHDKVAKVVEYKLNVHLTGVLYKIFYLLFKFHSALDEEFNKISLT